MLPKITMSPTDRFWSKVNVTETCWLWTATKTHTGYGRFWYDSRQVPAHRWAYEQFHGITVPKELDIDHLCRVPSCVRPDHLEAVTHRENMLRGENATAVHARQTACIHGHPFDEENTILTKRGRRRCRACKKVEDYVFQQKESFKAHYREYLKAKWAKTAYERTIASIASADREAIE